jgi:hypothetical protein
MSTTVKPPPRLLPLLYLGTAHVSLALAFLFAACWPRAVAGFFYHSWLIGLVHLVTLGWISFSSLGAIYIVAPLALRMALPVRKLDYVAYGCAVVGVVGMVGHFWIREYGGMAWSAGTVATGVIYMTVRIVANVRHAAIPAAVKLHVALACMNFWIASSMGVLIALDKVFHFLPGFVLTNVFAHAHLAALGWAAMMVVGVGYRLLPMTFPSKMPSGGSLYASAILLETGVLGLFHTLLLRSAWAIVFGLTIVGGLAVFLSQVVWMRGHLAAKPAGAHRVEFGLLHAGSAGLSLVVAVALGCWLLVAPASPQSLQVAAAYGVVGLLGFLAQMVVAMEARLLPLVSWFWSYEASGYSIPPPSPHATRDRTLQAIVFAGWTAGVPALAVGMWQSSSGWVSLGAWALFVAVAIGTLDNALVIARTFVPDRRS